jgi:dTDP-4-amino-4,6-dideoxygalactose transaminase
MDARQDLIPLVRPKWPDMGIVDHYLQSSRGSNVMSNQGPAWNACVQVLNEKTGKFCLPVQNGTVAITLALQTRFQRGARIAIPDFTHAGTLQAVIAAGMKPVLAPVEKDTWALNVAVLDGNKQHFDGAIAVSPFGYWLDFARYEEFSRARRIPLIYDLAGAWGMPTHHTKQPVTFSFHATKNLSCGEGGVVCFDDQDEWERARKLSNFHTLPDRTIGSLNGSNYKIDEFKAAIICAQLENDSWLKERIERKRLCIDFYQSFLHDSCLPHSLHSHPDAAPSLCVLGGLPAKSLETLGPARGVTMKQYYILLSRMDCIKDQLRSIGTSSEYFTTCCALPSDATDEELDKTVDVVRKLLKR